MDCDLKNKLLAIQKDHENFLKYKNVLNAFTHITEAVSIKAIIFL